MNRPWALALYLLLLGGLARAAYADEGGSEPAGASDVAGDAGAGQPTERSAEGSDSDRADGSAAWIRAAALVGFSHARFGVHPGQSGDVIYDVWGPDDPIRVTEDGYQAEITVGFRTPPLQEHGNAVHGFGTVGVAADAVQEAGEVSAYLVALGVGVDGPRYQLRAGRLRRTVQHGLLMDAWSTRLVAPSSDGVFVDIDIDPGWELDVFGLVVTRGDPALATAYVGPVPYESLRPERPWESDTYALGAGARRDVGDLRLAVDASTTIMRGGGRTAPLAALATIDARADLDIDVFDARALVAARQGSTRLPLVGRITVQSAMADAELGTRFHVDSPVRLVAGAAAYGLPPSASDGRGATRAWFPGEGGGIHAPLSAIRCPPGRTPSRGADAGRGLPGPGRDSRRRVGAIRRR